MTTAAPVLNRALLLLSGMLLLAGCTNPFSTRTPEEPEAGRQSFIQPRSPEIVLENLRVSFLEQNVENFLRCLSDSSRHPRPYRFVAAPAIAADNPGVFGNWRRENERIWFTILRALTPVDSLHLLSLQTAQNNFFADSALFVSNYTMRVNHTQQNQGIPTLLKGEARFWLSADDFGDWAIYRWEDRSTGEDPPWSLFKALYGK